jgi:endoglucanase
VNEEECRRWFDFLELEKLSYVNWSIADKAETAAALLPGAQADGGWNETALSASGRFVRDQLRRMSARAG